jgi:hypothetical protein
MARNKIDESMKDNKVKIKHTDAEDKMNNIKNCVKDEASQILKQSQQVDRIDF